MGELIALPLAVRSCLDCTYVLLGPTGTYCSLFGEYIFNEVTEAADCDAYDADE